jgi:hypothetical protein
MARSAIGNANSQRGGTIPVSHILRTAWERFQIIGQVNGDYVARFVTSVMYFSVLIPFALIARFIVDPLEMRKSAQPHWRKRKLVGETLDDARSQS